MSNSISRRIKSIDWSVAMTAILMLVTWWLFVDTENASVGNVHMLPAPGTTLTAWCIYWAVWAVFDLILVTKFRAELGWVDRQMGEHHWVTDDIMPWRRRFLMVFAVIAVPVLAASNLFRKPATS